MQVSVSDTPSQDWDAYVSANPLASLYHQSGWVGIAGSVFSQKTYFLEARDERGMIGGVLPLVEQRSLLFGRFMTSVPYFSYGGAVADTEPVAALLMDSARDLAQGRRCRYLELRGAQWRIPGWVLRDDKVTLHLDLPSSAEALSRDLGAKLRSQIRRADREDLSVRKGHLDLLDDFYAVFCMGMRDLGTPVYPKAFFRAILERFPGQSLLVVAYRGQLPAAAAFMTFTASHAEVPWAACRADAKPAGFNMRLYWELLCTSIERGCRVFDFGRSTVDSGTYRFKRQWGARPVQLFWHRWDTAVPAGSMQAGIQSAGSPPAPGLVMRTAVGLWKRLPLPLANRLGPLLSPGLPW
jgi:serine/alanine adding enzyme